MFVERNDDLRLTLFMGADEYDIGDRDEDIDDLDDTSDDIDEDEGEDLESERDMTISEDGLSLKAVVTLPVVSRGVVVFSYANGTDRFNLRNLKLARALNKAGYATVLADLLTDEEAHDRGNVFDIDLLASRVTLLARWVSAHPRLRNLPLALMGAGTGSAAALKAAAQLGDRVQAVVSRGGRPDLASDVLGEVHAPTLLIVGSEDTPLVSMNRWACSQLNSVCETKIVEGADHLFEEEGALEEVARLSRAWLERHMTSHPSWKSSYMRMQQQYII